MADAVANLLQNVLIVDAYPIVRIGVATFVTHLGAETIADYTNMDQAFAAEEHHSTPFSLAIIGIHNGDFSVLNGLIKVLQTNQARKILVIAEPSQPFHIAKCIAAGVHALMSSTHSTAYLADVIQRVASGQRYIDTGLMSPASLQKLKLQEQAFSRFSHREREIADYLKKGVPLHIISEKLNIAYTTVATYRDRILKKAKVSSTAEFIRLSLDIEDSYHQSKIVTNKSVNLQNACEKS